jgi:outer membrane protein assembly factor BamB
MIRRTVKALAFLLALLAVAAGGLYLAGTRIYLDGGGTPHIAFAQSASEQERRIAAHREAQRAQAGTNAGTLAAAETATAQSDVKAVAVAAAASEPTEAPGTPPAATSPQAAAAPARTATAYWTDFRGPGRDGHYQQQPIAVDWPSAGLTPMWKQPIGGGYGSFVIAQGRAFTIEQRGKQEVLAAYDIVTGRELWTNRWNSLFTESMGGDGPRATPTWHDGRVYTLGARGELRALNAETGATLWRTNMLEDAGASNLQWGMSAAPLVVDDTVVVLPGGSRGRSVVAYDRLTGRRAWSALDDQQAYSSPMLVTLAGRRQILVFSASRLMGLTPDKGEVLWEYPWKTNYDVNASQPLVIGDNRVFVSTGYGTGAAVIEITPAAGGFGVKEIWRNIRMKNQFTSSVLHDGFIYGLDESILACVDAATGELKWKGGRYGYGHTVLASGHLIVLTEGGDLVLVRATPERHQELARFPAIEGKTWNHPALSDGYLLVRNINEMAAFDLRVRRP